MKYPTVSSLCEGVAESIRRKEGSTEKINPQDFAQRIDNLQVGGGIPESNIEYLDVSGIDVPAEISMFLGGLCKFTQTGYNSEELAYKGVADVFTMMKHSGYDGVLKITALAIPTGILNLPIKVTYLPTGEVTDEGVTKDVLAARFGGVITQILNCPRITKEQFYTL